MPQLRPSLRSALIAVVVVLQAFLPLVDALPAPVRLPSLPPVASAATGAAWAWGRNNLGQLGDGSTAQRTSPVQVSGLDGVTALAGGGEHTLALKSDGTVWAWGDNATGQLGDGSTTQRTSPVQVSGLTAVTAIAAGNDHSLALKDDGTVWAWGSNGFGRLGDGTTTNRTTPVQVSGLAGITAIAVGGEHSLALKSDGTVWTWGNGGSGRLGDGTSTSRSTPAQVGSLTGVTAIAAGAAHSVAVKGDGTVWTWGANSFGQLGDGTTTGRASPVQVVSLTGITAVAAAGNHNLARKGDGTVWAWGYNSAGQLGDNTLTNRATPVQVSGLNGVTALVAGTNHSLALTSDGSVWSWGDNAYGQLGDGTTTDRKLPGQLAGLTGVTALAAGGSHGAAVRGSGTTATPTATTTTISPTPTPTTTTTTATHAPTPTTTSMPTVAGTPTATTTPTATSGPSATPTTIGTATPTATRTPGSGVGTAWGWGSNGSGRLGDGTTASSHLAPVQVKDRAGTGALGGIIAVAAGGSHSLALREDGTVWAWGANSASQLGDGTTTNRLLPVPVTGLSGIVAIAAGTSHSLALKGDGSVWTWGANGNGRLGDGTSTNRSTPVQVKGPGGTGYLTGVVAVAAGTEHSLALASDGGVWAWGRNDSGQLGDNSVTDRWTPVRVKDAAGTGSLGGVLALAGGTDHSLALKDDGTIWAWGSNGSGRLGDGTTISRRTPVQVKDQAGTGPLTQVVAVAAGAEHSLALRGDGSVWTWGRNNTGQLGSGAIDYHAHPLPAPIAGVSGVTAIAAGANHSLALHADTSLWAWGSNGAGRLGDGTTTTRDAPVQVTQGAGAGPLTGVRAISAGAEHSLALQTAGATPTPTPTLTPTASPTPMATATATLTVSPTGTPPPTVTATPTATATPSGIVPAPAGTTSTVTVAAAGQTAALTFQGSAGQRISLMARTTFGTCNQGATVSLLTPDGAPLLPSFATGSCDRFVDRTELPATGAYTVVADPDGDYTGDVRVTLYDVTADATSPLAATTDSGATTTVTIGAPGQNAHLTFQGAAGQHISLVAGASFGGISVYCNRGTTIAVRTPSGADLVPTFSVGTCAGFVDRTVLPETGTYTIDGDPWDASTGTLTFTLYDVPPDATGAIVAAPASAATPVTLAITTPGQNAQLTFQGAAGQRVSLLVSATFGNVGYYCRQGTTIAIRKPDGADLVPATSVGTCAAYIDVVTLPTSGTYTIIADAWGAGTGSLTFTLYDVPPDAAATIAPDDPATTITLGTPGQNGTLTFEGTAGQRVSLLVSATFGNVGYYCRQGTTIAIRKPDGADLVPATSVGTCAAYIDVVTLLTSGTYTIIADAWGAGTGNLTFTLYDVPPDVSGTLAPGDPPLAVTISRPGQNARLTFAGVAGQTITLGVSATFGNVGYYCVQGTTIALLKPDGADLVPAFSAGTCANGIAPTMLPVSGTYTIVADPWDAGTGTLTVTLGPTGVVEGAIAIDRAPYTATHSVTLTLWAASPSGDPVTQMHLWDGEADTGWVAFSPTLTWTLPAGDGAKTVRAQFRDAAGNLSRMVEATTTLDTTPPALTLDPLPAVSESSPLTLKWTGGDNLAGLDKITLLYAMDDGPEAVLAELAGSDATEPDFKVFVGRDTRFTFRLRATDKAGNVGEPSAAVTTFTDLQSAIPDPFPDEPDDLDLFDPAADLPCIPPGDTDDLVTELLLDRLLCESPQVEVTWKQVQEPTALLCPGTPPTLVPFPGAVLLSPNDPTCTDLGGQGVVTIGHQPDQSTVRRAERVVAYLLATDEFGNPLRFDRSSAIGLIIAQILEKIKNLVESGQWARAQGYLAQLYRLAVYSSLSRASKVVDVEKQLAPTSLRRVDMIVRKIVETTSLEEEILVEVKHMTQTSLERYLTRMSNQVQAYLNSSTNKLSLEFVRTRTDRLIWAPGRIILELQQRGVDVSRVEVIIIDTLTSPPNYMWRVTPPGP